MLTINQNFVIIVQGSEFPKQICTPTDLTSSEYFYIPIEYINYLAQNDAWSSHLCK